MSVGRNELCPCGSGKKYKKCCGVVTPITQFRSIQEQKLRKEYAAWIERLNNYVSTKLNDDELRQARKQFADEVGLNEEVISLPQWTTHFLNWYVLDVQKNGTTMLESYLKQHGSKMEHELRRAFLRLSLGLYEIEQIEGEVLTVRDLFSGEAHYVVGSNGVEAAAGQIIAGRLLTLGLRDLLFSGSLILQSRMKPAIVQWINQHPAATEAKEDTAKRGFTTQLYRLIVQQGEKSSPTTASGLICRVYPQVAVNELLQKMEANGSFELKKRDQSQQIWVYAKRKEQSLFPSLNNALIELHEVLGEVLIEANKVAAEGFQEHVEEIEKELQLAQPEEEQAIHVLTSTGAKLQRGTLFITSSPTLPSKILQWAVQTYFAEKWLVTPHDSLSGLPPILAAASERRELRDEVEGLIEQIEYEGKLGHGLARFMRIELLRPRLSLPNDRFHIANLLKRPLIEGLPDSVYTVQAELLSKITQFVQEMTEGKSEATVKKYDEVMVLFRTFVRGAFGPSFQWSHLRQEELAYFLVHHVLERVDTPTKTLAVNILSVLMAFFKWLDKEKQSQLTKHLQPLLVELKDDLPEAYRIRGLLQKDAFLHISNAALPPKQVSEEILLLLKKENHGWLCQRKNGEQILLQMDGETASSLTHDWLLHGLIGQSSQSEWHLYGTPELYPPVISQLLGIQLKTLV